MLNIKFKGKFRDESQLKEGELPVEAIKFNEPDSITKAFLLGGLVSLPVLVASTILLLGKINEFGRLPPSHIILNMVISFGLMYVHEWIHALSLPKGMEKQIWTKHEEGALFVHFNQPISKKRFIWVCLAPNLMLGFIPFIVFMSGAFDFNGNLAVSVGFISWTMILGGIGDYLNIYNALRQVPQGAQVQNYGMHSYWIN